MFARKALALAAGTLLLAACGSDETVTTRTSTTTTATPDTVTAPTQLPGTSTTIQRETTVEEED